MSLHYTFNIKRNVSFSYIAGFKIITFHNKAKIHYTFTRYVKILCVTFKQTLE